MGNTTKQIKPKRIRNFAWWARIGAKSKINRHIISGESVVWEASKDKNLPYYDHIEMAGFYSSAIISYGADKNGRLRMMRHVTFPTLRTYPNLTGSSLKHNYKGVQILVDGTPIVERVKDVKFNGVLSIVTTSQNLVIKRELLPATDVKGLMELLTLENCSGNDVSISIINKDKMFFTNPACGVDGATYKIECVCNEDEIKLKANEKLTLNVAYIANLKGSDFSIDFAEETSKRFKLIKKLDGLLVVDSPDENINNMVRFAKIRASESIFNTKNGLMHSPGGGSYYAALWTNDQCEYVNPFFAYLGYDKGIAESVNCYKLFGKFVSKDKPLVSSIIAEGDGYWNGAKDRGDSAMYAYGSTRFLLSIGDEKIAEELLLYIEDSLTFTMSQLNEDGVVCSDSDELENRFQSGKANLSTSCLAYDALISASYLEKSLLRLEKSQAYEKLAVELRGNIEKYFGKNIDGYDTYRYCKEEKKLRSWICWPLVVGIENRAKGTISALLSKKLCKVEGLVSRSGNITFWDRSTLYALRGIFSSGHADDAISLLQKYSESRLLGEHVPYAIEAFPEGNKAQLSAESGLYVRVIIEGIAGYRPTGLNEFVLKPNLPSDWQYLNISKMFINNNFLDIKIKKDLNKYFIELSNGFKGVVDFGESILINIDRKHI